MVNIRQKYQTADRVFDRTAITYRKYGKLANKKMFLTKNTPKENGSFDQ